ncbi:probable methyltransferase PMT23 [Magnolia sinica]|uniref:probable methyltransferase PMT23 n=1 Tax=Magnolia sinica TaxID=86752 RepID=UPI0026592F28|nr:probable methyltransferase PMT23 [Magnolia sinica]XP_058110385.1 probable methyltransferase PMT23 [Magnolia sinica]XP_058110386.1 probable methyltransferase PMT23 [Magnolia sinica]XP_058110387.1 probable methyltransferase PMT23 [Magnolia sinica]XP_058110389.1 probable methyltransferase PMT23 [Magnolia sinica]XP_058110390.1 probable methyltransferase PMT23 [Magnolia sinica]
MASPPSLKTILTEKKYPFIFALFVLLLCVSFFLLTSSRFSFLSPSDLEDSQKFSQILESSPLSSPIATPSSTTNQDQEPPISAVTVSGVGDVDSKVPDQTELLDWKICNFTAAIDYIPCLDNWRAIKELQSRRHMEHRERHCPTPTRRCLVPLPKGYKFPVAWPRSRDMIWFDNVPHSKLVEYKKDQNWVRSSGDFLVFPGGGTQFKQGVTSYIQFIEKILPSIQWGKRTRVILDVGCGVASFGGNLLDKGVLTMSLAPKDEHEAQIQFALERGIPAILSVIGTQRLTFPDNVYDVVHCARCRVHWDADGGKPLLELNRILRPGGFFVWSATPVYRDDERDQSVWNAMVALTESICWKMVVKTVDSVGIGIVMYQKPVSNACYEGRKVNAPPLCDQKDSRKTSWYVPLDGCLPKIPVAYSGTGNNWPKPWPKRLSSKPSSLSADPSSEHAEENFYEDTKNWATLVSNTYFHDLAINWSSVRNVMDMNAVYGGFAAALVSQPLWVMNTVPADGPDTLPIIFDRGLIGVYHDWCESFNTYPRTYDLLHSSYLFGNLTQRCDIIDVVVEMDRILRPGGWVLVQDTMATIERLHPIMHSLHWDATIHQQQFLVSRKGFWRPAGGGSQT